MRLLPALIVLTLICSPLLAQQTTPAAQPNQVPAQPSSQKPGQLPGPTAVNPAPTVAPETVRFDINLLDKQIDPCTNFYAFTCSKWMAANPIPPDQSTWGRFTELVERNRQILRGILEKASADDPKRDSVEQKIGDYYASCMDENSINTAGIKPLQPELDRIAKLTSKQELTSEIILLHRIGSDALFNFGSQQDFKDANLEIAVADQGGLGLPDRDYYFKTDQKSADIRKAYQQHVETMMELLGDPGEKATEEAKVIMDIETALAKGSLDRTTRRDPLKIYHPMSEKELASLAPSIDWKQYFIGIDMPATKMLNVAVPDFFKAMNGVLKNTSFDDLKTYLRWHLVHTNANVLPDKFVNENFNFYSKTLRGQKELSPRWKRCVQYTDEDLGEALGQKYVDLTFGVEGKQRTLKMVHELEGSLQQDIKTLPWMTEATKQQALVKLHAIANKIGYPDKWRDYSTLKIVRGDALGNSQRANEFEFHRQLNKIGKPVDRGEWEMSPPTVNAYYDPQMNNINFPAGILQPPFFDNNMDDAVNFGGVGAVIGHELTHGFDDQGRQFDAKGNLRDWWTPMDAHEFEKRAQCIVNEYSSFKPVDDVHLNGKLTLGENTADNGGLRIALMALMNGLDGKAAPEINGYTPEQRLFLAWGQIWCENRTDEVARLMAATNPHSPGKFRVNGVVSNMPEFQKAFHCSDNAPMVRHPQCRVW